MKDRTTRRVVVDWGHLALLLVICAVVIAYLLDARATSLKINNLLLVEPAAIIALILAAVVLPQCFRRKGPEDDPGPERKSVVKGKRVAGRVDLGGRRSIKKKINTTKRA